MKPRMRAQLHSSSGRSSKIIKDHTQKLKNKDLKAYASLARIGLPKSFSGKIMLVVFAGTQLPLIVLVLYLLLASPGGLRTHSGVVAALLIATLLGFVATLLALRAA